MESCREITTTMKQQVAERPVREKTDTRRLSTNPGSGYGVEKKHISSDSNPWRVWVDVTYAFHYELDRRETKHDVLSYSP